MPVGVSAVREVLDLAGLSLRGWRLMLVRHAKTVASALAGRQAWFAACRAGYELAMSIDLALWIAAIILWLIAAFGQRVTTWPGLTPLGLALAGLTFVI